MTLEESFRLAGLDLVICYFEFWSGVLKIPASDWSVKASSFPCDFLNFYSFSWPVPKLKRAGHSLRCKSYQEMHLSYCELVDTGRRFEFDVALATVACCSEPSLCVIYSTVGLWRHKNDLHLSSCGSIWHPASRKQSTWLLSDAFRPYGTLTLLN